MLNSKNRGSSFPSFSKKHTSVLPRDCAPYTLKGLRREQDNVSRAGAADKVIYFAQATDYRYLVAVESSIASRFEAAMSESRPAFLDFYLRPVAVRP